MGPHVELLLLRRRHGVRGGRAEVQQQGAAEVWPAPVGLCEEEAREDGEGDGGEKGAEHAARRRERAGKLCGCVRKSFLAAIPRTRPRSDQSAGRLCLNAPNLSIA